MRNACLGRIYKKGKENPNFGRKASDSARKNMSISHSGERHRLYGKHQSEEIKRKISQTESIQVVQLSLNGELIKIWNSLKDAKDIGGFQDSKISSCCRNKIATHGGFVWMYLNVYQNSTKEYVNEIFNRADKSIKYKTNIPIIQLDLDWKFIKQWSGVCEIQRQTGFHKGSISNCCIGRSNSSYGFKWMYAKDYYKSIDTS